MSYHLSDVSDISFENVFLLKFEISKTFWLILYVDGDFYLSEKIVCDSTILQKVPEGPYDT
jgi:hypothetical protein